MGLIEGILAHLFPPRAEPLCHARHGRRVLLRGQVVPRDLMESPLTGERCVYYRYLLEEWRPPTVKIGLAAEGLWSLAGRDEAICEFYLQDATGRALVSPQRAQVHARRDLAARPVPVPGGRRAFETCIIAGDTIEVEGVVDLIRDLLDENRGYRDPSTRYRVRAPDEGVLRIRLVARPGASSPGLTGRE